MRFSMAALIVFAVGVNAQHAEQHLESLSSAVETQTLIRAAGSALLEEKNSFEIAAVLEKWIVAHVK